MEAKISAFFNWVLGLYNKYVLPKIVHYTCSLKPHMYQRQKVVPLAYGNVLEIGIGSGLNLSIYDPEKVTKVWGLDPSPEMREMAEKAATKVPFDVEFIELPGEEIPLQTNSIDSIVMTYTLCTIPDPLEALHQMLRVLKPDGKLFFCEHGIAPDKNVRRWQNHITPVWKRLGGGCHLNRNIPKLIKQSGFHIDSLETMYLPGWRPATYNYWGTAVKQKLT